MRVVYLFAVITLNRRRRGYQSIQSLFIDRGSSPEVTTLAFASHQNLSKLSAWWRVGIVIERTKLV